MPAERGSLTVVGVGIQVPGHVTAEVRASLETADEVLYLVADPVAAHWIERVAPDARSLHDLLQPGRDRDVSYAAIVDAILERVRAEAHVCVAFYGHPGVFVNPSHEAIRRARSEGFEARMLPGVSADACLFADLGIDPSTAGCQSYEATDLLLYGRAVEPTAALVIWQAGAVGNFGHLSEGDPTRLPVLVDYLRRSYAADHPVVVYEASSYPVCGPLVRTVPLSELAAAGVSSMATLYLEPVPARPVPEMIERLGLEVPDQERAAAETAERAARAATTLPFAS